MRRFFSKNGVQSLLWLILLLSAWEFVSQCGIVNAYLLPPFTTVLSTLFQELAKGKLGVQVWNSMYVIIRGFLLSFALAIFIALLCTWLKPLERLFTTLCTVFSPLPAVAVMPLIIMWFGVSDGAMTAIIVHGVIWALLTHTLDGFRSIPVIYREWGKNIGLNPWRMFSGILIFAIMPNIIAGVRVGWGRAWRALISAEMVFGMIGSLGGLGYYIYTNRAYANMPRVMSGVVAIIIIGILIESVLFKQLEKRTILKWGMTIE